MSLAPSVHARSVSGWNGNTREADRLHSNTMSTSVLNPANVAPPFVEIVQIHQCLRMEVTELAQLVSRALIEPSLRNEVKWRFEALKSIYESHSKAEDEIIFPELQARGLSRDACEELDRQHHGQHDAFIRLEQVLNTWSEEVVELADQLRASIVLHLRMEEEELLPLLEGSFQKQELGFLVGRIIGDRSSEVLQAIIHMLSRNLPPEAVQRAIADFKEAAQGTQFSHWMSESQKAAIHNTPPELLTDVRLSPEQGAFKTLASNGQSGCAHYQRGLKLWLNCCQKLFPCVRCHDEAVNYAHQADLSGQQAWCMECGAVQRNPGSRCVNCNALFGTYSCRRCGLWENNRDVHVYHCPFCDVCRIGSGLGADFFHCMRCNACVSTKMRYHRCVEGSLDRECPVCYESLFNTTKPIQYVRCGHVLHKECFQRYLGHDYRCASCRCSMVDMSSMWTKMRDLSTQVTVTTTNGNLVRCNDCGLYAAKEEGPVRWLVQQGLVKLNVGEQCNACGSFNTL